MATMVANLAAANMKTLPAMKRHGRHASRVSHGEKSLTVTAIATPQIKPAEVPTTTMTSPSNWASAFCDHLERQVMAWSVREDACERDEVSYLLAENYAPVSEMAPTPNLPVVGTIPACLNGQFLRNGPNPKFQPVRGYHWFDGDGMIHGLNIKDGKATYAARYVQTSRLLQEERYGASKFVKVGDMVGMLGYFIIGVEVLRKILGVLDASKGVGTGNTALIFHNNKLLALHERDRPYSMKVLEDGDLQTVRIEDYGQKLNHPCTAHPKIDPVTGEMFMFTYNLLAPHLIYRVVSKEGILGKPVPFTMPSPVMMNDFAISKNYAIFMDGSLCLHPQGLATGGFVFKFDSDKESRLGIFPRYATKKSHIQWFKIPSCFVTHTVNAWEERDEIVLMCCQKERVDFRPDVEFKIEKAFGAGSKLYEYRVNLKSHGVNHKQLSHLWTDFPQINPKYTGRKVKYAYCAVFDDQDKIQGIAKYDLSVEPPPSDPMNRELKTRGNIVGVFHYGPRQIGGEAIFVPRKGGMEPSLEDDGYLISFVYDANTNWK